MSNQDEEVRLIKRYQNRKMYDTTRSGYIVLNTLLDYVLDGVQFRIIDNVTKKNITSSILTKAFFEYLIRMEQTMDTNKLRALISETLTGVETTVKVEKTEILDISVGDSIVLSGGSSPLS